MAAATGNHGAATEHAQEPPPAPALQVLLCTEDIQQLRTAERALVPQRSLHKLARDALNAIASAGPNSSMDRNLENWFPWRPYVACHKHAHAVIGSGITLAKAEFMDGTSDGNRGGQLRLDFVFYRTDGTICRLHPGTNSRGDAKPIYRSSPATGLATEQTSTGNDLTSLPANPYTYEDAVRVPQVDRMSKSEAYRLLQQTPCGPLVPGAHDFKWWLWICNIGNAREIIGCGIVAATLENKRAHCVQLLLTRSDNTEARLQLLQLSQNRYSVQLAASSSGYATERPLHAPPRPASTPGHATEQTKDESATQQLAASSSGHATGLVMEAAPEAIQLSEAGCVAAACPQPIKLLEAGRVAEAEGSVLEAHLQRGYELEATMAAAQQSYHIALTHLEGAMEAMD